MPSADHEYIPQPGDEADVDEAYRDLQTLCRVALRFARVERAPQYPDGRSESDVEHSFHLALSATELAAAYFPTLDAGLVAQFSLVHDLPEVYAGDTPSFNLSDEDRAKKEAAERAALNRLLHELPPHTAGLLERYERQEETEARFVRFIDKIMPILLTIAADNVRMFKEDFGVTSRDTLQRIRQAEAERLQAMFPEFSFVHALYDAAVEAANQRIFPDELL